jgi:glycosyltransferase involved in cell wall biosynthesis
MRNTPSSADAPNKSAHRVLHVFKDIVRDPRHYYLGSTKDIRARTEYFKTCRIAYDEYAVDQNDHPDARALEFLKQTTLERYTAVVFEHSLFPKSIIYLKTVYPQLRIAVRGHNAELYHGLHQMLGCLKYASLKAAFGFVGESLKKYRADKMCAAHADIILSIAGWESRHYWRKIAAAHKVRTAPFYLPDAYRAETDTAQDGKKDICVCPMSTVIGPFLYDSLRNFQRIVTRLPTAMDDWHFQVTGRIPKKWRKRQMRLEYVGLVKSPYDYYKGARLAGIFSDLGFGFKTKILEAIMCGCYVVVPRKLYARLPAVIRPYCKVVDPGDTQSFRAAIVASRRPFPNGDPNAFLKAAAFASYESICP